MDYAFVQDYFVSVKEFDSTLVVIYLNESYNIHTTELKLYDSQIRDLDGNPIYLCLGELPEKAFIISVKLGDPTRTGTKYLKSLTPLELYFVKNGINPTNQLQKIDIRHFRQKGEQIIFQIDDITDIYVY